MSLPSSHERHHGAKSAADGPAPVGPLAPIPAPEEALHRVRGGGLPANFLEVRGLHELHAELSSIVRPVRDGFMPLTLVSGGEGPQSDGCPILRQGSAELKGLFTSLLRSLLGDSWASDVGNLLTVEVWGASCLHGAWYPLQPTGASGTPEANGAGPDACSDGERVAAWAPKLPISSAHEGVEAAENMLQGVKEGSAFVVIGINMRRYASEMGSTLPVSLQWVDIASQELLQTTAAVQSLRTTFSTGETDAGTDTDTRARKEFLPHPLLSLLSPVLQADRSLAYVVVGDSEVHLSARTARALGHLITDYVPKADAMRRVEITSLRESSGIFATSFRDLCHEPSCPLPELLRGEISVRGFGFPSASLPSLRPYVMPILVTSEDKRRLISAAEAERAICEENGWVPSSSSSGPSERREPRPLHVHLADCYELPENVSTSIAVRSYGRSQDQSDPLVRTIRRLREDTTLLANLLPLCAVHPFSPVRLLRLGGIHSLLTHLSDSSSLSQGSEESAAGAEALGVVEIAALVLTVFAAFAPVRRFLVAQRVMDIVATAIRHPASERHLAIFAAMLIRLCQEPEHRRIAADAVAPALAAQVQQQLLSKGGSAASLEALLAAAASLSPFLPLHAFENVIGSLLGQTSASAPQAFHFFAFAVASSMQRSHDVDFGILVPRLLSMLPMSAPEAAQFHSSAAGLLAVCSHTAATHSLSRRWVAATAIAVARRALRSGPGGLRAIRASIPLAAAPQTAEKLQEERQDSRWFAEVEETITLQSTLRWTLRGTAEQPLGVAETDSEDKLGRPATAAAAQPPASAGLEFRPQRLHGSVQLMPLSHMATSPNAADFQERPQIRIAISDAQAEVFLSVALLPVTHCQQPLAACGCCGSSSKRGCGGQVGLWLCELPSGADRHGAPMEELAIRRHQLDLRPPVHASAAQPGCLEYFASVQLTQGLYSLIPFCSHEAQANAPEDVRAACRATACGCVDVNMAQAALWEHGSQHVAVSVWSECTGLKAWEAIPFYMKAVVDGALLAQSVPLWLRPQKGAGPIEVLLCTCSSATASEDPAGLRGSDACLDLWPAVQHRRVRNERTGALRIHVPEVSEEQPLRVTCLWQDDVEPAAWTRRPPRLLIYASGPLQVIAPPPFPSCPAPLSLPQPKISMGWQAAMLLSGGWTPGYSSGFKSLRNPQIVIDIVNPPGRGEELQLIFYLGIPSQLEDKSSRPTTALTIFTRQERTDIGVRERLVEGQMRKEMGSSKAAVGGYVTAQLTLSGAEARQQLFVVLQNSSPQEIWPWQVRVLARLGRSTPETGTSQPEAVDGASGRVTPAASDPRDDPPIKCSIVGGTAGAAKIYVAWPETPLALYTPKQRKGEVGGPVLAWVLSRDQAEGHSPDLLRMTTSLGDLPLANTRREMPGDWPKHFLMQQDPAEEHRRAARPVAEQQQLLLEPPRRVALVPQSTPEQRRPQPPTEVDAEAEPALSSDKPEPVASPAGSPAPAADGCPDSEAISTAAKGPTTPAAKPPVMPEPSGASRCSPANAKPPLQPMSAREGRDGAESKPWRREARARERLLLERANANDPLEAAEPKVSSFGAVHSERHTRVEALLRRRRHGGNEDALRSDDEGRWPQARRSVDYADKRNQASSQPPPRHRGGDEGDADKVGRADQDSTVDEGHMRAERSWRAAHSKAPRGGGDPEQAGVDSSNVEAWIGNSGLPSMSPTKCVVKLQRKPGADRLGFGNVAAGPREAPVLMISWIRDGALAAWNAEAPEASKVVPRSAILKVNGVSGDIQRMREELRAEVVEMEVAVLERVKVPPAVV